jgi:hypothetical protein
MMHQTHISVLLVARMPAAATTLSEALANDALASFELATSADVETALELL